jgi:FlaA1/EpsC-like NDP-sugar epimerase
MIRLSGASEAEVEIVYTGVRPGEKLFEELSLDAEDLDKTRHDKIFIGKNDASDLALLYGHFDELLEAARTGDDVVVRSVLKRVVPKYAWDGDDNVVPLRRSSDRKFSVTPISD